MSRRWLSKLKKVVRNDSEHQFLFYMAETFGKDIDDPFFEEMDPIKKYWYYESWVYKLERDIEAMRAHGILIGSFTNPEAAQKMMKRERPDFGSSDADFEKSISMIEGPSQVQEEKPKGRRNRKIIRQQ